ncbi:MAG: hypothetical protein ACRD0M_11990, partial [Acidimicrobiales bacterium]
MTTVSNVELPGTAAVPRPAVVDYRGRTVYLPGRGLVVVVEARRREGWWCRVIASRHPDPAFAAHVDVTGAELAGGQTRMRVDPGDPDGYAMAWVARVWACWPGGRPVLLARVLVEQARPGAGLV